jgi:protein-disulfide isomerase
VDEIAMRLNSKAGAICAAIALCGCAAGLRAQDSAPRPVNERGPSDAPVRIVEYCAYESEPCARLNVVLGSLLREFAGRVHFTFRYLPPADATGESLEHSAAFAAGAQNHFWEMHDLLFANRGHTSLSDVVAMAKQLGLDTDRFRSDLSGETIRAAAKRDSEAAVAEGITTAPTVVVNGRQLTNVTNARDLRPVIQEALAH